MAESPTSSNYPTSLDTWNTLTDKEDLAEASDINKLKNAILAIQTELGLDPAGTQTDLVTRLGRALATNGAIANGTSFPGSPNDGDIFYRTDENVLYVYNGSSWDSQGQSLSNVIFSWAGVDTLTADDRGLYIGTTATPAISGNCNYMLLITDRNVTTTLMRFRFTKIAGISTVTIHGRLFDSAGTAASILDVDIGGQSNSITRTSSTPGWATTADIDVSSLSDGTTYEGQISLESGTNNSVVYCSGIVLVAS